MSMRQSKTANEPLPVEPEEIATHKEAVPVPWWAGTRKIAVRWMTPAMLMITEQAPQERPGKK
jgi:hypothetical protein